MLLQRDTFEGANSKAYPYTSCFCMHITCYSCDSGKCRNTDVQYYCLWNFWLVFYLAGHNHWKIMVKIAYIMFRLNGIYPLNRSAAKWWSQNLEQNVNTLDRMLLMFTKQSCCIQSPSSFMTPPLIKLRMIIMVSLWSDRTEIGHDLVAIMQQLQQILYSIFESTLGRLYSHHF